MVSNWSPEARSLGKKSGKARKKRDYTSDSPLFDGLKVAPPEHTLESQASRKLGSDGSGGNQYLECEETQNGEPLGGQECNDQLDFSHGTAGDLLPSSVQAQEREDEMEMKITESPDISTSNPLEKTRDELNKLKIYVKNFQKLGGFHRKHEKANRVETYAFKDGFAQEDK